MRVATHRFGPRRAETLRQEITYECPDLEASVEQCHHGLAVIIVAGRMFGSLRRLSLWTEGEVQSFLRDGHGADDNPF